MFRTANLLKILLVSLVLLLGGSRTGSVFAQDNEQNNDGTGGANITVLLIDPTTPTTLYAGTLGRGVFKTTNSGATWSIANTGLPPNTDVRALAVDPTTPSTLYAGTLDNGVYKSTDGGGTWNSANSGLADSHVCGLAIDPTTPAILYAGTNSSHVYKTMDGGMTWNEAGPRLPAINACSLVVDPVTPTTLYAGTDGGGVSKSTDGGTTWRDASNGLINKYIRDLAIDPTTPTTLYAGTGYAGQNDGGVFKSTDGGANWGAVNNGLANLAVGALAIDMTTPATLYAGTLGGGVFKSMDGGETWNSVNSGLTEFFVYAVAIDPTAPNVIYAGTGTGAFKSTTGGGNWVEINTGFRPLFTCENVTEIPRPECEALVALYDSTHGPGWANQAGWLVTNTPCGWYGVTCQAEHVRTLNLEYNLFVGAIPSKLGDLVALESLDLASGSIYWDGRCANRLSGDIPPELGGLSKLQYLDLSCSYLSGAIPAALGSLANLQTLDLSRNELSGSIPSDLGQLRNLQVMDLERNALTGPIPTTLGDLTNLQGLYLRMNRLSKSVPSELGDLAQLESLDLHGNPLSGPLPRSLMQLSLSYFFYDSTGLCEPSDAAFQAWLAGIPYRQGTGVMCRYASHLPMVFAPRPAADSFWADRYRLELGECTTLHWSVSLANTLGVYLDNQGVAGQGMVQVCPVDTHTYILRVERTNESQEYHLTIVVAEDKGLTELVDAYKGKYRGTSVTMYGPFIDEDAVKFNNSIKAFEDATGIDIQYEGLKEFEYWIIERLQAGNLPDIADFPQPRLLDTFVQQGEAIPLSTVIPTAWLKENYLQSWLDMATYTAPDGTADMYGIWQRFNGKSQVWYPKKAWDEAGYQIPTTWEELLALQDQIVSDGDAPWCIGIESGAATGWPATDWAEDLMLRTTSLANYDRWVKGELKFSSPEVKKAIGTFAAIWDTDKYVYGGRDAIVTTFFADAPAPMFENPPKCWLHRQGNWITSFFPKEAVAGVDYDFFYLPPVDPQYGKPYLVVGDILAMFDDRPEVRAIMQFFSTGESVKGWLGAGGVLSPHNDSQLDWYGDPVERKIAEVVKQATSVRFDASDLMPSKVGASSFWKGMTDYFSGTKDLDTVLKDIDESWPAK